MARITVVHAPATRMTADEVAAHLAVEDRHPVWRDRRPRVPHGERVNRDLTHSSEPVDVSPRLAMTDAWDGSLRRGA